MGVTDISRNVKKYKMFDRKRDEVVGEEYGITCVNILELTRQKYVVITCGKNA
jgi:hypothetical protein